VVDSAVVGNKIRFANCGRDEDANCIAQIKYFRGDHHILLVAARDIEATEEILFDYGDNFCLFDNFVTKSQRSS